MFSISVDSTEEGDYRICFDNSFSRMSEKMVYVEVIMDGPEGEDEDDEDWAALAEPEDSLEYKLEDIRVEKSNISSFIGLCLHLLMQESCKLEVLKGPTMLFQISSFMQWFVYYYYKLWFMSKLFVNVKAL